MKDPRSKKAIAAGLSLTLALGSVPAVAFADNAGEGNDGDAAQQGSLGHFTFDANGGQFKDGNGTFEVDGNEGDVIYPEPTRAGYTFKGWYSQRDMSQFPPNLWGYNEYKPTAPQAGTWFAAWEKNATQSIEVVSHFVGGDRDGSSETTVVEVPAGSYVSDCVKGEVEGYTAEKIVSGVATSKVEVYMTSSLEGITTLHVYYEADKVEEQKEIPVTYVANGGQFADGQEVQQGLTDSKGYMRQPLTPTREGYTFAGWYWVSSLEGLTDEQKDLNKVDFTQPVTKEHAMMFAQWVKNAEQNEINVLYVANGGQFADGNDTMMGMTDSKGFMRQPAAPTREGYTFAGWYWHQDLSQYTDEQKEADKVDFTKSVAGMDHAAMYAQWTKNAEQNEIDVMYVANGGQFATGETFQQGMTDADGFMRQPAAPTREGYTFDGWYWHADLSQYTAEQKALDKVDFTAPIDRDATMYAQWSKVVTPAEKKITVKFVDNFNKTESTVEINEGEAVAQPKDPSYKGWSFEGWSSTLTDEQGNAKFTPVDFSKVVADEDEDGVVTYYAFYTEDKAEAPAETEKKDEPKQEATEEDASAAEDPAAEAEAAAIPQTGDATNAAGVAGVAGIAGLLAAAAALIRRRFNN